MNNDYYEPIDSDLYKSLVEESIYPSESMFNKLKKHDKFSSFKRYKNEYKENKGYLRFSYFFINELRDEWFLCSVGYDFYKCDQFDGLLKCLEDNFL